MCVCMSALATHFNPYSNGPRRCSRETVVWWKGERVHTRSQLLGRETYRSVTELLRDGWLVCGGPQLGGRFVYISECL